MLAIEDDRLNYARRQKRRRLWRAGRLALAAIGSAPLGLALVSAGLALPGGLLLGVAVMLGLHAHHWLSLARRSAVGARSEDEVRRTLEPLQGQGWRLRHGLRWRDGGDIASVAIAPTGVGFRSRRRAERTTSASSAGWSNRLGGLVAAGGGGAAAGRLLSCPWFARLEWSDSSTVCWWSRSTGLFPCCGR
jgi:hypothetical protein